MNQESNQGGTPQNPSNMQHPKFNFATLTARVTDTIQTALEEAIEEQVESRLQQERVSGPTATLTVEQMGRLAKRFYNMGVNAMREEIPHSIEVELDIESHCGRFSFNEYGHEIELEDYVRYIDKPEFDIDQAMETVCEVLGVDPESFTATEEESDKPNS